jgi:hypothetical protein
VEVQVQVLVKVDLAVALEHIKIIQVVELVVVTPVVLQRITVQIMKAAAAVHSTVEPIK